jgi:hypothetical protein
MNLYLTAADGTRYTVPLGTGTISVSGPVTNTTSIVKGVAACCDMVEFSVTNTTTGTAAMENAMFTINGKTKKLTVTTDQKRIRKDTLWISGSVRAGDKTTIRIYVEKPLLQSESVNFQFMGHWRPVVVLPRKSSSRP